MGDFHDVRLPTTFAVASKGGPYRPTEILTLASGQERRNARWSASRRRYDVGFGIKSVSDLAALVAFFEARRGQLHGFRFRDPLDHSTAALGQSVTALDQAIGVGAVGVSTFQLVKAYGAAPHIVSRRISRPVAASIVVAVNGEVKQVGTHVTIDAATGTLNFQTAHRPLPGDTVTAGFEFDVPVRFDVDQLNVSLSEFKAGQVLPIPVLEIME